jgi:hypothetical protein
MAMSRSIGMYANVRVVLDQVVLRGRASLTFPSTHKAHYFRQRSYYFRKLLHEAQLAQSPNDFIVTSTPYDNITFSIDANNDCRLNFIPQYLEVPLQFDDGSPDYNPSVAEQTVERTVKDMEQMNADEIAKGLPTYGDDDDEDELLAASKALFAKLKL